jgi:hypothetical protein
MRHSEESLNFSRDMIFYWRPSSVAEVFGKFWIGRGMLLLMGHFS